MNLGVGWASLEAMPARKGQIQILCQPNRVCLSPTVQEVREGSGRVLWGEEGTFWGRGGQNRRRIRIVHHILIPTGQLTAQSYKECSTDTRLLRWR